MTMRPAAALATVILSLIAVGHVLRLVFAFEVVIAGVVIPMWVSVPALAAAGGLAIWLAREARDAKGSRR